MEAIAQPICTTSNQESRNIITKIYEVIVVGAGFSGVGAAIKLKKLGMDYLVLEKANEIGGVWRENTYPDCACDVPSALYSYSFAPNPRWSKLFAGHEEIQNYTLDVAQKYGVMDKVRTNHELIASTWNTREKCWELKTSQGIFRARFVIMACGPMHKPVIPGIKGLDNFTGETFHSSQWNHEYDLKGKRVAVIGSGASAVQFVPEIQKDVEHLTLFQRTPHWILPKFDKKIPSRWQQRFERFPFTQKLLRGVLYAQFEALNGTLRNPKYMKKLGEVALKNIYRSVKDPELREKLTPDYVIGCKRILLSSKWYPALTKPNVDVVDGVVEIQGNRVISADGSSCEVDAIIFATGFEIANPPIAERVVGASGKTLASLWNGSPRGYLGTTMEDCPNSFFMFGPNLAVASSAFIIIEAQLKYIENALKKLKKEKVATFRIDPNKLTRYNKRLQQALDSSVWNQGGCSSYFLDKNGRNSTAWPWTTFKMKQRLSQFKLKDYFIERA